MESDTSPPHRVEHVWFRIVYYNGNWDGWRSRALEDHFQFFLIFFTLAEPYPGLIYPRALLKQNGILAHQEAILADRDAIWANNNSLSADRRMPWKRKIVFLRLF